MIIPKLNKTKFALGQVVFTQNARQQLNFKEALNCLFRHAAGDWGNVCPDDADLNNQALIAGDRILSAYGEGELRFWIITESDRSVTTILMPEDY